MLDMFDPNSTVPRAPEVRVTRRGVRLTPDGSPVQVSTRSDFIAPDMAPVSTSALEQAKGLRGWTDMEVKPEDRRPAGLKAFEANRAHLIADRAAAIVEDATCGKTVSRKAPARQLRTLNVQGPAHRRQF